MGGKGRTSEGVGEGARICLTLPPRCWFVTSNFKSFRYACQKSPVKEPHDTRKRPTDTGVPQAELEESRKVDREREQRLQQLEERERARQEREERDKEVEHKERARQKQETEAKEEQVRSNVKLSMNIRENLY